ncbi:unnamed protein product, partial [Nippostrongylus brasiliensis]|uniref:Uncharacterized protein n=1 Tax=Nippostrongylus brasiliensis TaxID=27835 RepID=A0A0N4YXH2_NIPBR
MTTPVRTASGATKRFCPSVSPPGQEKPSMDQVLKQINDSVSVPDCLKIAINILVEELSSVKLERDKLYEENLTLRRQLGLHSDDGNVAMVASTNRDSSDPVSVSSGTRNSFPDGSTCCQEIERRRSVILCGIPELDSSSIQARVRYDYLSARNVILPASYFQRMAVRRSPQLRTFANGGVFLRESLSKEARAQR